MHVRAIIARLGDAWQAATRHPFLDGVRDGTLPAGAFATWLSQDHRYVGDLLVFQARLLARAPRPAQAALIAGLAGLEAELTWFEAQAHGVPLDVPRLPATMAYQEFLTWLDEADYATGIIALWAIEQAYLDAWRGAAPGHPTYREFVEHWTTPAFVDYVAALERAADAALAAGADPAAAEQTVREVARLERDFWEMAWRQH